mmetsp:Transcript_78925/g.109355  ORF Transcript_78925/g.109355 Transcript_78925/m.109355 type:complete len:84 (+) Transcript_78925:191-442(+)
MGTPNFDRDNNQGRQLSEAEQSALLRKNLPMIIKLQSWWRGYHARKLISLLRSKQLGSSKYFTVEEAKETVTKRPYDPNMPRE